MGAEAAVLEASAAVLVSPASLLFCASWMYSAKRDCHRSVSSAYNSAPGPVMVSGQDPLLLVTFTLPLEVLLR